MSIFDTIDKKCTLRWISLLNILLGLIFGVTRTSFQSVLDPAEWMAGIVHYPPHHPFAEYCSSSTNFQTYLAAGFLKAGLDEFFISVFYCCATCILYLLFWQNTVYFFTKSRLLTVILPQLLFHSGFLILGLHYEIVIPPGQATFGPFAIIFACWSLSLLLREKYQEACILIALMPLVHPYIGMYFIISVTISILLSSNFPNKIKALTTIMMVGGASFLVIIALRGMESYVSSASFVHFMQYNLSKHRVILRSSMELNIIFCGLMILSCVYWRHARNKPCEQSFFFSVFILVLSALILSYVNSFPLIELKGVWRQIYNSIPLRNANIIYLLLVPMALSLLSKPFRLLFMLFLMVLTLKIWFYLYTATAISGVIEGPHAYTYVYRPYYLTILLIFVLCLFIDILRRSQFILCHTSLEKLRAIIFQHYFVKKICETKRAFTRSLSSFLLLATFVLSVAFSFVYGSQLMTRVSYYKNDNVLSMLSKYSNFPLVVAGTERIDRDFTQSRSRRPLLYDIQIPATLPYLGVEPTSVIKTVNEIYGLNLLDQERKKQINLPCDGLSCTKIKNIFCNREKTEWQLLSKKYNFCDVLVPKDWKLQISLMATNSLWSFYHIENCRII